MPTLLTVAAAIVVGVVIARFVRDGAGAVMAIAAAIAIFTLLAVRGFVNSWWLVYSMTTVALAYPAVTIGAEVTSSDAPADEPVVT